MTLENRGHPRLITKPQISVLPIDCNCKDRTKEGNNDILFPARSPHIGQQKIQWSGNAN